MQLARKTEIAEAVNSMAKRFAAGTNEFSQTIRMEQDLVNKRSFIDKRLTSMLMSQKSATLETVRETQRIEFETVERDLREVRAKISDKFPNYAALGSPEPLTPSEVRRLLDKDEALIAFDIEKDTGFVWVVTSTNSFWTELPISAAWLSDNLKQLRLSLTNQHNIPFDPKLSFEIYKKTIAPISHLLDGKKRISVFSNSALTSIPLGLLVTQDPNEKRLKDVDWLIKDFAITVLPSIYSLKTMRSMPVLTKARRPMIAFADPVFAKKEPIVASIRGMTELYQGGQIDFTALREFPHLPGTRAEVEAIRDKLRGSTSDVRLGINATETAVKNAKLSDYKIVYFATHGLVAGDLSKFSKAKAEPALVMTIPDNPTAFDDGLLQAGEIAELKLDADWVVLSACNTATSDFIGAEALSGLARSFLYAGARSIVASHWDVEDKATARLMTDMFTIAKDNPRLWHGEALQQAMLKMLRSAKNENEAHPRVWAPFVVIGEPARQVDGR